MQTKDISDRVSTADEAVEVRLCQSLDELQACVELQKEVWGFADADLIPLRMFVVAQKIGGQVIGGFRDSELIGFALAIPGNRGGHPYLHSHMLAVREQYRNSGLGRRIKLAQRQEALKEGIELMEWTFDPLEIKNAYLNLHKLGAIARRYNINQYGISSSPLQGGLPTDRLIAEWWLRSRRVIDFLDHGEAPRVKPELTIEVPAQVYEWKANPSTRARAAEVHALNRELFLTAFARGLAALEYQRDSEGNGRFVLGYWDENWSYGS
ncbi:MAG TPA: GNAT family N-acetyltransferase [Terriglobales bacterium]|nr:GNAT family N-acetyltransferase [Terriglobales bacterium]